MQLAFQKQYLLLPTNLLTYVIEWQLKPEKIDYKIKENSSFNHTDEYDEDVYGLVVRRGKEFDMEVTFNRPYDEDRDDIILQLTFGTRPQQSKNTLIRVVGTQIKTPFNDEWGLRAWGRNDNMASLKVMTPYNALVGEYKVFVETKTRKPGTEDEYVTFRRDSGKDDTVIVLFNAWCHDDAVYMEDDEERQEYVMNPTGYIWPGKEWNFGQFENISLKTCLFLLEMCQDLDIQSRGDPVMVTRFITKMVNSNDADGGILVGNWSGNYKPHTDPLEWAGSVRILEGYNKLKHKREGVKYGQCWVFSGLVTTLCRAIGSPTRSVTNFASAWDTDSSTTIDFHSNEKGEPLDHLNGDFVWNFHVWNESYFKRRDLPRDLTRADGLPLELDGWQAIDATPQERSQGVFCLGPAPVQAIKEGLVYIPYDTRFVFGEVNGDRVYWTVGANGELEANDIHTHAVGKYISTKAVRSKHRNDVTSYYKYDEGTAAERDAMHRAYNMSSRRDYKIYKNNNPKDVAFKFLPPDDKLVIGSDFDVQLWMKNNSGKPRSIDVTIVTRTVFYTGITAVSLDKLQETHTLHPTEEKTVSLPVPASKYIGKSPAETNVKAFITAKVKETGQVFHDDEVIELQKPDIVFKFDKDVKEKKKFDMTLSFKNPLQIPLENGVFNIETARYVSPDTIRVPLKKPVKTQEEASVTVTLEPQKKGWRYVTAKFTSDQLTGIGGFVRFKVNSQDN